MGSCSDSISRRVYARSLCHEYQFSVILKLELIDITKIADQGELGNGLLVHSLLFFSKSAFSRHPRQMIEI